MLPAGEKGVVFWGKEYVIEELALGDIFSVNPERMES